MHASIWPRQGELSFPRAAVASACRAGIDPLNRVMEGTTNVISRETVVVFVHALSLYHVAPCMLSKLALVPTQSRFALRRSHNDVIE